MKNLSLEQITYLGRKATVLTNSKVRVVVDELGGMVPEFSLKRGKGAINAHWLPDFRNNSGLTWEENPDRSYWKGKVLYNIAGDFICSPSFGADCTVNGVQFLSHGWTANETWKLSASGILPDERAAYVHSLLESPDARMPLFYEKFDIVVQNQPVHFHV